MTERLLKALSCGSGVGVLEQRRELRGIGGSAVDVMIGTNDGCHSTVFVEPGGEHAIPLMQDGCFAVCLTGWSNDPRVDVREKFGDVNGIGSTDPTPIKDQPPHGAVNLSSSCSLLPWKTAGCGNKRPRAGVPRVRSGLLDRRHDILAGQAQCFTATFGENAGVARGSRLRVPLADGLTDRLDATGQRLHMFLALGRVCCPARA